jgi:hypothetical protein
VLEIWNFQPRWQKRLRWITNNLPFTVHYLRGANPPLRCYGAAGGFPYKARVVEWQTRTFEGRMPKGMRVQVPPRAPMKISILRAKVNSLLTGAPRRKRFTPRKLRYRSGCMSRCTFVLLVSLVVLNGAFAEDIETLDHKLYKDVTITRAEPDGIVVVMKTGIIKIPFDNLPREFKTRFGYDEEQAKAFAAKVAQDQQEIYSQTEAEKERQAKIREAEGHIRENEKRIAANEAENRAKIEQTIARHELFIGMTPEQCVESRGKPDKINVTTTSGGRQEQWVYSGRQYWVSSQASRGTALTTVNEKIPEGWRYLSPCYVYFENGVLTTIQDSQ